MEGIGSLWEPFEIQNSGNHGNDVVFNYLLFGLLLVSPCSLVGVGTAAGHRSHRTTTPRLLRVDTRHYCLFLQKMFYPYATGSNGHRFTVTTLLRCSYSQPCFPTRDRTCETEYPLICIPLILKLFL